MQKSELLSQRLGLQDGEGIASCPRQHQPSPSASEAQAMLGGSKRAFGKEMSLRKCELSHMGRLKSGRFKLHLRNFNRNARKKNKSWKPAQGLGRVHRLQQQRWAERGAAAPQGKTGLLGGRNPSPEGCTTFSPRAESSTLVLLQLQVTSSSTSSSTSLLQTPPSSLRDLQPDPALPFPHTQPTAGVLSTPPALHGAACAVQPHQRLLEVPTYGEGNCSDSD